MPPRCYSGALLARVASAKNLPKQQDLQEIALTGGRSDPYVELALLERCARTSQRTRASNATARAEPLRGGGD